MSEQSEQEDQTEEPTEKKLRDAAERGDVPVSREAPIFAGLLAALIVCAFMLRDSVGRIAQILAQMLDEAGRWDLRDGADAALLLKVTMQSVAGGLVPIFVVFAAAGIAISCAQNLPSFVLDRIKPKLSKVSPTAGAKRLFGRQGLVHYGISLGKLAAVAVVMTLLLQSEQQSVTDAMFTEPEGVPERTLLIVIRLLSGVSAAFVVLTALEFVWARFSWRKRMLMSRREIKEEFKQAEGNPLFKAKRRSLALDRSRRRMIADVPRATVIIANPTHYAIALRYIRKEGGAPVVVAKGQDLIALKIREIAEQHGITVVENKPLARSMYDHVEVSQAIPPEFYKAVAEIIHYVQSRSNPKPIAKKLVTL